jgi:hypothetical protein
MPRRISPGLIARETMLITSVSARTAQMLLPLFDAAVLRDLFQANILGLLLRERMISPEFVDGMKTWHNSGFHTDVGEEIPGIEDAGRVGICMVRGLLRPAVFASIPHRNRK